MNGFVKLHRRVKGHWVTSRPEWFQAWTYILMSANYETGRVNLTEVYRELSGIFDNRAWRYLVEKLQKDGMLADLEGRNLGSKAGYQQTGTVANWAKYHENSRGARGGADVGASAEHYAEQIPVQDGKRDTSTRSHGREERGASAEHYAESNKNTFQEDKEKPPPLPPQEAPTSEASRVGEGYSHNLLQHHHPEVFRLLCRIKSIAGANDAQFGAWCERLLSDCRKFPPGKVETVLSEMALSWGSLNIPWVWYAKQLEKIGEEKGSDRQKVEYGDIVSHPEHGEWRVSRLTTDEDYCENEAYEWVPVGEVTVVAKRADVYA